MVPQNYIRRIALLLFVLFLSSIASAQTFQSVSPSEAGFSEERLQRLTDMLDSYAESKRISGGVLMVLRDG